MLGTAAPHATGVENAEIAERNNKHNHADRKPDVAVGDGEVGIVAAAHPIEQQCHDADERGQKERGKARSQPHQQRRKPAKIAKGYTEQNAFAAGAGNIMGTIHLK